MWLWMWFRMLLGLLIAAVDQPPILGFCAGVLLVLAAGCLYLAIQSRRS